MEIDEKQGWVKLYRNILDNTIWVNSTMEQKIILITLLCMANHEPKKWEFGNDVYTVQPGQFITSLPGIVKKCNCKEITIQKVRTALERFEKLGFLTDKSTNKNRLVTIVNWGVYQSTDNEVNSQNNRHLTGTQQALNRHLTPNKKERNKEYKNYIIYIVEYLNEKAGTAYKSTTQKTISLINARLNEGFTVNDFEKVIDNKVRDWKGDEKMQRYLRPETLFGTKFESYLNENAKPSSQSTSKVIYPNKFVNYEQPTYTDAEIEAAIKRKKERMKK